jgi:hypothetical protein
MYVIYNVDMISYNKIYIRRRQYEHGYCWKDWGML